MKNRLLVAGKRAKTGMAGLALLLTGIFLASGPISSEAATVQPHASTCSQPGGLFAYGSQVVGIAVTPDDAGYWIVNNAGQIAACGMRHTLAQPQL